MRPAVILLAFFYSLFVHHVPFCNYFDFNDRSDREMSYVIQTELQTSWAIENEPFRNYSVATSECYIDGKYHVVFMERLVHSWTVIGESLLEGNGHWQNAIMMFVEEKDPPTSWSTAGSCLLPTEISTSKVMVGKFHKRLKMPTYQLGHSNLWMKSIGLHNHFHLRKVSKYIWLYFPYRIGLSNISMRKRDRKEQ